MCWQSNTHGCTILHTNLQPLQPLTDLRELQPHDHPGGIFGSIIDGIAGINIVVTIYPRCRPCPPDATVTAILPTAVTSLVSICPHTIIRQHLWQPTQWHKQCPGQYRNQRQYRSRTRRLHLWWIRISIWHRVIHRTPVHHTTTQGILAGLANAVLPTAVTSLVNNRG